MNRNIPVIILAGGFGTRISEETDNKPKPMVIIGGKPILWHVMHIYASQGFSNFVIATGYKHEVIDNWVATNNFANSWDFSCNAITINTGLHTQTSGRVRKVLEEVISNKYMLTYGDGLGNINLNNLVNFHNSHGKLATVTAVRPPARFGVIQSENGVVTHFGEKNQADSGWINGGFMVIEREIYDFLGTDDMPLEKEPMSKLVQCKELMTYLHSGFWQPMDTLREKQILDEIALMATPAWLDFKITD